MALSWPDEAHLSAEANPVGQPVGGETLEWYQAFHSCPNNAHMLYDFFFLCGKRLVIPDP